MKECCHSVIALSRPRKRVAGSFEKNRGHLVEGYVDSGSMTSFVASSELCRANQLDTIAAVLPYHQRDALASLLTDDDIATLKHLVDKGLGANTLRAMASDLAYLDAWSRAATGNTLPWPAQQPLLLKFIAHHLWDAEKREASAGHGMPDAVADALKGHGQLRQHGPHAPATVRRRLALWATLHHWRGLTGPFSDPHVRTALKVAIRSHNRSPRRKSPKALTADIIEKLLATCDSTRFSDVRDTALLLVGFASGGRRRSELAALRVEQLSFEPPVPEDATDPNSPRLNCMTLRLGRTKTEDAHKSSSALLVGRAADALHRWLTTSAITEGPVFRAIDRWGKVGETALTPESVNHIIKRRCVRAGLDPSQYSAHGLRSGYMTEAGRRGIPLLEAMQQSRHKTVQQASVYYNEANRTRSHAVRMMD